MDPGTHDQRDSVIERQTLAAQLVAGVLGRALTPLEDAVLGWGIQSRCNAGAPFTLADLHREILDPPEDLVRMSRHTPLELARATSPVTFALDKLCSRTLRGMFDGPTTVHVDWDHGPGVVLDLSAVYGNSEALPLVMVAATHWLTAALRDRPERRSIQVIDEAWAAVRHGAAYLQGSLKLSRTYGVATVLVCHRPSDLSAQADDGTASSKIAAGLLSDIQTRVLLRQPPEQIAEATEMFDLTDRERGLARPTRPRPSDLEDRRSHRRRADRPHRPRAPRAVRHRPEHVGHRRRRLNARCGVTRWPIDEILARTDLAALLDELAQPAQRGPARGTARSPTTTTTTPRSRCAATTADTNGGAAGPATTAATPST